MGKRKKGREADLKGKSEIKKVKIINEKCMETKHEDLPVEPKCAKLLDKRVDTKVNDKVTKGKKNERRNKLSSDIENRSFIQEPKSNKIIFFDDDEPQEVPSKKSKNLKKALQGTEEYLKVIDEPKQEVQSKKSKKRDKLLLETEQDLKVLDEPKQQEVTSKKSKKRSKNAYEIEKGLKVVDELKQQAVSGKKPKKRNKSSQETENDSDVIIEPKGNKIIFNDEELQKTTPSLKKYDNTEKKKKFLNNDEAQVREEDIDKFCDELNEKDNAQYEAWVKLIEANFHSNKKKSK